jgi:membrane protease YdiL (CAAX protease family)
MIKKHPLASFYILAFLFSWLGWSPHVAGSRGIAPFDHPAFMLTLLLAGGGPALAATAVAYITGGKAELRALYRPLGQWRVSWYWYAAALLGPGLLFGGAAVLQSVWSGTAVPLTFSSPWYAFIPLLAGNLLINVWEEVGWRGFALPRWQRRYNALLSALIVGLLWGLWHLPLFFVIGHPFNTEPFAPWLVGVMAGSVIYTWLYNGTAGSLLIMTLHHATVNSVGMQFYSGSDQAMTVVVILAAVLLTAVFGPKNLTRESRVTRQYAPTA